MRTPPFRPAVRQILWLCPPRRGLNRAERARAHPAPSARHRPRSTLHCAAVAALGCQTKGFAFGHVCAKSTPRPCLWPCSAVTMFTHGVHVAARPLGPFTGCLEVPHAHIHSGHRPSSSTMPPLGCRWDLGAPGHTHEHESELGSTFLSRRHSVLPAMPPRPQNAGSPGAREPKLHVFTLPHLYSISSPLAPLLENRLWEPV